MVPVYCGDAERQAPHKTNSQTSSLRHWWPAISYRFLIKTNTPNHPYLVRGDYVTYLPGGRTPKIQHNPCDVKMNVNTKSSFFSFLLLFYPIGASIADSVEATVFGLSSHSQSQT
ncbi:hypothetical protein CEXT_512251 [Caerostris extrusa]|uniref:Uncharacterized protein n=1 Tax=Caerostris extrusa TaxID=172846 RepID=A0AAV4MCX6_CAEEX|nr:hypothetical protein CEXT_512251 [Caerostris extrusa]